MLPQRGSGYRLLLLCDLLTGIAVQTARAAILVAAAVDEGTARAMGALVLAEGAAILVAGFAAAPLARRLPAPKILPPLLLLCAALLAYWTAFPLATILLFGAIAVLQLVYQTVRESFAAASLRDEDRAAAGGLAQAVAMIALSVGVVAGAALGAAGNAGAAAAIGCLLLIAAAGVAGKLPTVAPLAVEQRPAEAVPTSVAGLLLPGAAAAFAAASWTALAPPILSEGGFSSLFGLHLSVACVAGVAASLITASLAARVHVWRLFLVAGSLEAAAFLGYAFVPGGATGLLLIAAIGACGALMGAASLAISYSEVPPLLRGRYYAGLRQIEAAMAAGAGLVAMQATKPASLLASAAILYLLAVAAAAILRARRPPGRALAILVQAGLEAPLLVVGVALLRRLRGRPAALAWAGRRLAHRAERLGPGFIKIAQVLSVRPDLLPPEMLAPLARLRDGVAPMAPAELRRALEFAYGPDFDRLLWVEPRPIAAGAVAQVHRVRHRDGRQLALKIRRPGVEAILGADCALAARIALLASFLRPLHGLNARGAMQDVGALLLEQTDLRREAAVLARFREDLAGIEGLRVPAVAHDLCGENVLAMELVERASSISALAGVRGERIARTGLRALYRMVFDSGLVHCDMHPGNLLVADGILWLVDAGMAVETGEAVRQDFTDLFFATATGDSRAAAALLWRTAEARPPCSVKPAFEADVRTMLGRHSGRRSYEFELTGFVYDLLDVQRRHGLAPATAFTRIVIGLAVYDGVCKSLAPRLDFQGEARAHLILRRYGGARGAARLDV